MSSITVTNVGKAYRHYTSRWARIAEWLLPGKRPRHSLKWIFQGINFAVQPGEAVGVIGANGAGKSTLLKVITGTTLPTTGRVEVSGRVAALLELGMGFHPEFTGRQNVLISGQLLGLSVEEITCLLPEIMDFAQIGSYFDMPVRVYSSGMQVRLAFAVATAIQPDVLIIDEALSVGDAAFQRKCFQRIENYRLNGATLLFVSHDIETVKRLCDYALLLQNDKDAQYGEAKEICDEYEKILFGKSGKNNQNNKLNSKNTTIIAEKSKFDPQLCSDCEVIYGNRQADIVSCWVENENNKMVNIIPTGEPFFWCYKVHFNDNVTNPVFGMMIKTKEGITLYGIDTTTLNGIPPEVKAGDELSVVFKLHNFLAPGHYYLNCGVRVDTAEGVEFLSRRVDSGIIKIIRDSSSTIKTGLFDFNATIQIAKSSNTNFPS